MVLDVIGATPEEKTRALQLWEVADVDPSVIGHARDLPRRIIGDSWDEHAAAERSERQKLLAGERPLEFHAVVDESALRRLVGGVEVMRGQLDHLVAAAGLPNVTIQVLPHSRGAYEAQAGGLHLLEFAESDEPLTAYVEALTGLAPVEDEDAEVLSAVWDDAARLALTAEESVSLIRAVRDTLGDS
ncbi:DUF5753 domain-containing protein [Actinosynnema sp. CA-299493]